MPKPFPSLRGTLRDNAVKQIVKKLPTEWSMQISKDLIAKTQEQWRILEARFGGSNHSTFGKGNSSESRAAVLLEYVVREQGGKRVPMKHLAKAVGMKEATLQNLHEIIGNHRVTMKQDSLSNTERRETRGIHTNHAKGRKHQSLAAVSKQRNLNISGKITPTVTSSRAMSAVTTTSSKIPSMALQLAGQLTDPHGVGRAAAQLLQDLQNHGQQDANMHNRRGHDFDIKRYWHAYEAVCLFYVATRDRHYTSVSKTITSRAQRPTSSGSKNNNKSNSSGVEDERKEYQGADTGVKPLELDDLLAVSNDFTLFELKKILPRVKAIAREIDSAEREKQQQQKKNTNNQKKRHGITNAVASEANRRVQRRKINPLAERTAITDTVAIPQDLEDGKKGDFPEDAAHTFEEWKEEILCQARHQAKNQIHQQTGKAVDTISNATAMAEAADTICRKYGLL